MTLIAQGKIVLITGGSRGLGLEIAKQFLSGGAKVIICARNREEVAAAANELGPDATGLAADISNDASVHELVEQLQSRGGLDVLVNNAAAFVAGPLSETTLDDYRRMLEVNLLGTIRLTEACLPLLTARHGSVVTIVTAAAIIPSPHLGAYAASKAALSTFMQTLAVEQAGSLHTLSVYPSYMPTGFTSHAAYLGNPEIEATATEELTHHPLISLKPDAAARQIYRAWQRRRNVLVMPWLVRLGVATRWLAPAIALAAGRHLLDRYYRSK